MRRCDNRVARWGRGRARHSCAHSEGELKHYLADNIMAKAEWRGRQEVLSAVVAEKLVTLASAVRRLPDDDPQITEILVFVSRLEDSDVGRRRAGAEGDNIR